MNDKIDNIVKELEKMIIHLKQEFYVSTLLFLLTIGKNYPKLKVVSSPLPIASIVRAIKQNLM